MVEVLWHLCFDVCRATSHTHTHRHTHTLAHTNCWHSCCCCSSCENLHAHKTIFVAVSRAAEQSQSEKLKAKAKCCSNIFAACCKCWRQQEQQQQLQQPTATATANSNINWSSALLPKDKQTICSRLAWEPTTPLASRPALVLRIDGGWCENSRCDLQELCNYFAYARLSKLNIQINSCLSFTVSRLIDFSVSPFRTLFLYLSLSFCVFVQLVPLGVCAINAMATRSRRMGHSMGSLWLRQTFLINF